MTVLIKTTEQADENLTGQGSIEGPANQRAIACVVRWRAKTKPSLLGWAYKKGKGVKRDKGLQRPHEAEPDIAVPVLGIVPIAISRPQELRDAVPTTATKHTTLFTKTTLTLPI